MTDGRRVREGRSTDLPALRAIQAAVLAEPWEELLAVAADGPPILLVATPRGPATATEDTATPVGYALAVTDGDDDAGYLAELAVAPDAQGEGHGSALLDALVERLRESGVTELRVTVREVDEAARAFYRDRGFERRERLPERYERGDGFLLARSLDD
jgi:ribosomal-protein-alanine N-acetyltransferase